MTFKDFFHFAYLRNKIKLDKPEEEIPGSKPDVKPDNEVDNDFNVNEWNQEYELIYRSYVLER